MSTEIVGTASCGRCGDSQRTVDDRCRRCGLPWTPAAAATGEVDAGPLAGVIGAAPGPRVGALLVDVAVPVLLVAAGVSGLVGVWVAPGAWWVPCGLGILLAVLQLALLATRGRTLGRLALRQRTVDDLTGTPLRPGRLLAHLVQPGRRRLTADLRAGRDPMRPRLVPVRLGPAGGSAALAAPSTPPDGAAAPDLPAEPRASIGIVLETGERYEIHGSLLLGRSPADPTGRGDRALLAWPDLSRRLAKTHVLLEWSGTVLWVTDLNSPTGTALVAPGGQRVPLAPGVRVGAVAGSSVECGGRSLKVVRGG